MQDKHSRLRPQTEEHRHPLLVLSLFPGGDLLGIAFEQLGATVVHSRDYIFGGDIRDVHVPPGRFDLVIGGPPCQVHSAASKLNAAGKSNKIDLIPEFVRIVNEAQPRAVVMENLTGPSLREHVAIPNEWNRQTICDWDCGGLTCRTRSYWTWPMPILAAPKRHRNRAGQEGVDKPWHSVMASTHKRGRHDNPYNRAKGFLGGDFPLPFYGELQGMELFTDRLIEHGTSREFAITLLGNGVPMATGLWVARQVLAALNGATDAAA